MIDPVIFTIGNFSLRWYGVIVMIGVIVGSLIVENELKRRGEDPETIWDALVWWVSFGPTIKTPVGNFRLGLPIGVLPMGIIGARLWYVLNATLGGSRLYIEDPSKIYKVWEGGLHIYGGLLFGAVVLVLFLRSRKLDPWLFFDIAGPAMLIGQAIGRIANFINQELYGQPTNLPWGIPIDLAHRLPQFANLPESTRFHPTFAYEMLWNLVAAGFLIWLSRRYERELKPGSIFAGWLMLAGTGRVWIEFFRPDQPKIGDSFISYSMVAAALMAVFGAVLLMARYKAIKLAFAENWEEEYQISGRAKPKEKPAKEEEKNPRAKKAPATKAKTATDKKPVKKPAVRKTTTTKKKTSTRKTKPS
ncbi:MAG TPA: prolipoprotein diacylglyceryl transferase [Anaerolineales bacterium]|nr:prolipoprotein diacylglyceryl transferase [Anaerolineales bacterium]